MATTECTERQRPFIRHSPAPGKYVEAWKRGKAITAAGGTVTLERFGRELDAEAFNREFRGALDRRINLRGGLASDGRDHNGRRTQPLYQTELERDVRELRDHFAGSRVRLWGLNGRRWRTELIQKRYGHLLECEPY